MKHANEIVLRSLFLVWDEVESEAAQPNLKHASQCRTDPANPSPDGAMHPEMKIAPDEAESGGSIERADAVVLSETSENATSHSPWRSLGGRLDYEFWPDRDRFLELDRKISQLADTVPGDDEPPPPRQVTHQCEKPATPPIVISIEMLRKVLAGGAWVHEPEIETRRADSQAVWLAEPDYIRKPQPERSEWPQSPQEASGAICRGSR